MRPASLTGLLLAGLLLGGCASRWQDLFVSYSDQMVPLRNQLLLGHAAGALPKVHESAPGGDTYGLDLLERGRIAWLLPPRTPAPCGKTLGPSPA